MAGQTDRQTHTHTHSQLKAKLKRITTAAFVGSNNVVTATAT